MLELRPYLDTHMSPHDDSKRPLPSAAEINAYVELSAARTKKRLPLAFGTTGAPTPPRDRKLRVAGAPKPELAREISPEPGPLADPPEKPSGS
jgi:hypothetical protein